MSRYSRRDVVEALASSVAAAIGTTLSSCESVAAYGPRHPIERDAELHVPRWKRIVQSEEKLWTANTQKRLTGMNTTRRTLYTFECWLKSIALRRSEQTRSFWEKRGWAGEVPVKTMSRLDSRDELKADRAVELTGIAFAGARGVRKVEVSLDGGETWAACELITPGRRDAWSTWRYKWDRPAEGGHTLAVRAVDGSGNTQTAQRSGSYPAGASGYDHENLKIGASA